MRSILPRDVLLVLATNLHTVAHHQEISTVNLKIEFLPPSLSRPTPDFDIEFESKCAYHGSFRGNTACHRAAKQNYTYLITWFHAMKRLCLLIAVVLTTPLIHATTFSWTNTLGGDWFTTANWSPNGTPGTFDTANITAAGAYTVTISSGAPAVANLNLGGSSGTQTLIENSASVLSITNAGTVGPNGVLTVNTGGVQGKLTVQSGGQLMLATATVKNLASFTLFNQGTVAWSGGQLQGGGAAGTVINNSGLWLMTGDNVFSLAFGGQPLVWDQLRHAHQDCRYRDFPD